MTDNTKLMTELQKAVIGHTEGLGCLRGNVDQLTQTARDALDKADRATARADMLERDTRALKDQVLTLQNELAELRVYARHPLIQVGDGQLPALRGGSAG